MAGASKFNISHAIWAIGVLATLAIGWGEIKSELKRNREFAELATERIIALNYRVTELEKSDRYQLGYQDGFRAGKKGQQ